MSKAKLKRGDVYNAEIKNVNYLGVAVYIKELEQEILLPIKEIKVGDYKKIQKKKISEIPVRVKTVRPLSFSAKQVDENRLVTGGTPEERNGSVAEAEEKPELNVDVAVSNARLMVWWTKIKTAARYTVRLYIRTTRSQGYKNGKTLSPSSKSQEIAIVEKDRRTAYHTFTDLVELPCEKGVRVHVNYTYRDTPSVEREYAVCVEAEDREGEIIAKSELLAAKIN